MTQEEKLLKRINSIDSPGLYEIIVYVTAEKTIAFWLVKRHEVEGEQKPAPVLQQMQSVV